MPLETVVMKIGGSIITDRSADAATPREDEMRRTAEEISSFDGDLVLVHGAGSYGHPKAADAELDTGISNDIDRQDLAELQLLQNELNVLYCSILQEYNVPAFPVQPSACVVMQHGEIKEAHLTVIDHLLDHGLVPVLYGTPALDTENDVSILSGDLIAPVIAHHITADTVLHATDVDGVYETFPPSDGTDIVEELTAMRDVFGDSGKTSVTGGMENKVQQLFTHGQNGQIFNGTTRGTIEQALNGTDIGTTVTPR